MNELALQSKIVNAYNISGGHAFKCSNRFLIGVVDLSQKSRAMPHAYNEVKLVLWPKQSATVQVDMTEKQRSFLRKYRKAGGISIYTIFAKAPTGWMVHIGHELDLKKVPVVTFDPCPSWVQPKLLVAKFEAYIAAHLMGKK